MNSLQNIKQDNFLRHNVIFFVGSMIIAVFNYLYYPVIGRLVSVSDFGEIQAIIAIFMQLGIILTAFGYVVTNIINNTRSRQKSEALVIKLEQLTLILCVAVFIILCLSSFVLKNSLQFGSVVPLVMVGFLVVLNVPSTSRTYFLQGLRRLKEVSISGVIFAAGKLLLTVILILMGLNVFAVMTGYILAQTATLIYLLYRTKGQFPALKTSFSIRFKQLIQRNGYIKSEIIYGLAILVLLSGVTLLYSSDSIAVRFFFSPVDSGMYSAISAVSKIVYFVTASVAGVLIATVKMRDAHKTNVVILKRSFGIITVIGGLVTLFFAMFPTFSISVLFGTKYIGTAYLLSLLSITMLAASYNNLLVCYEIALRRFKAIYFMILSVVLLIILLLLFHDTLTHVIIDYLVSNALVLVLLSIHILRRKDHAEAVIVSSPTQL